MTNENYKPSRVEKFSNQARQIGKGLVDLTATAIGTAGALAIAPYALPSIIRSAVEDKSGGCLMMLSPSGRFGSITGMFAGLGADIAQVAYAADNPRALLIPLATNIVSGLYEAKRYLNRRQENKTQA